MELRKDTRGRCEAAWRVGLPLKTTSDGFPIVSKPSQNCQYTVEKTGDIAYVGLPGSNVKSPTKEQVAGFVTQVRAYLKTIPRLTVGDLDSAPEGVYTWLLYSKDGSAPQFAASKTATMLELGTTHYSIATSVGATAVHGAGELWKHGTQYTFNFLSGTFMQSWTLPKECSLATMQRYIKHKLQTEVFPDLFRGRTLTFSDETFITPRFFENTLTTAELETYVRAGFVVCIYPEGQWDTCKKTKAMCANPVTLAQSDEAAEEEFARQMKYPLPVEQMRGGNPPTITPRKLPGMGGRKKVTRKTKMRRRKTRRRLRGGVEEDLDPNHVGVRMAESLLAEPAPPRRALSAEAPTYVPPPPEFQMFEEIATELNLTVPQEQYMVDVFYEARDRGIRLTKERLRQHIRAHFRL